MGKGSSMKERAAPAKFAGSKERFRKKLVESPALQRAVMHGACFTAGLICSRGVIFGRHAPMEALAAAAGTIPYELLCSVSKRVPRVYR